MKPRITCVEYNYQDLTPSAFATGCTPAYYAAQAAADFDVSHKTVWRRPS